MEASVQRKVGAPRIRKGNFAAPKYEPPLIAHTQLKFQSKRGVKVNNENITDHKSFSRLLNRLVNITYKFEEYSPNNPNNKTIEFLINNIVKLQDDIGVTITNDRLIVGLEIKSLNDFVNMYLRYLQKLNSYVSKLLKTKLPKCVESVNIKLQNILKALESDVKNNIKNTKVKQPPTQTQTQPVIQESQYKNIIILGLTKEDKNKITIPPGCKLVVFNLQEVPISPMVLFNKTLKNTYNDFCNTLAKTGEGDKIKSVESILKEYKIPYKTYLENNQAPNYINNLFIYVPKMYNTLFKSGVYDLDKEIPDYPTQKMKELNNFNFFNKNCKDRISTTNANESVETITQSIYKGSLEEFIPKNTPNSLEELINGYIPIIDIMQKLGPATYYVTNFVN